MRIGQKMPRMLLHLIRRVSHVARHRKGADADRLHVTDVVCRGRNVVARRKLIASSVNKR